ncbi:hypothetical protein HHK36_000389 [Tetracentron sinense]|uniref:C2H2-type domain-containing protein n=1 Tax=Tetracentron sinense TaxID=13715 RepID=A0A834ZVF1_TETSI|nr:hypothetical protein HHK36_000389 [Tetracentron sinense]
MAMILDQQPSFKHFCRICKRGFGCGRALGGHMRAHGIGDENEHIGDEEPATSDWEEKLGGNSPSGHKRMYALRTNPNRFKSCKICENCGKEFFSWNSFLEHGKCSSDDVGSLVSSPGSDDEDGEARRGCKWSKGKRSKRAKMGNSMSNCPSSEEEDLANCLVMLSSARVLDPLVADTTDESCAETSKEEEERRNPNATTNWVTSDKAKGVTKGVFECKACKKVFNSHQALGGHRASHKKVKGCFAAKLEDLDESLVEEDMITHKEFFIPAKSSSILPFPSERKSKVHECSICHRIFSSGQALGGHKRCHWVTSNSPDSSSITKFHQFEDHSQKPKFNTSEPLDLNLPAPSDDIAGVRHDPDNPLSLEVPTEIYLIKPRMALDTTEHYRHNNNDKNSTTTNNINASIHNLGNEADSSTKVMVSKLSDLKDMNLGGVSSPWLQVGIGTDP